MVRTIQDDAHFQAELSGAGVRLVAVDFTANWCGPCQRIGPTFATFPGRYPQAVFLKVDVDKCPETASAQGVSVMPTFAFYRECAKIDSFEGSDAEKLQAKVEQHLSSEKL